MELQYELNSASLSSLSDDGKNVDAARHIILFIGEYRSGHSEIAAKVSAQLEMLYFSGSEALSRIQKKPLSEWEKRTEFMKAMEADITKVMCDNSEYKGVVIDRQALTWEDLSYFVDLLQDNFWRLSAVVCCEHCPLSSFFFKETDPTTMQRLTLSRDVIVMHKDLLQTTCQWKTLHCPISEMNYVQQMRALIIDCNNAPSLDLRVSLSNSLMESKDFRIVTKVKEYCRVVTRMYELLQINKTKFPTRIPGHFLNNDGIKSIDKSEEDTFVFREMKGGTPYLLYRTSTLELYVVPRHLRCIYRIHSPLFNRIKLKEFILDGELLCKNDRKYEVFLVHDCLAMQGKSCYHRDWAIRQKYISDCMIPREGTVDFRANKLTFLHQRYIDYKEVTDLIKFDSCMGIFVVPTRDYHIGVDDKTFCWYPPQSVRLDLRVGKIEKIETSLKRLVLECLDTTNRSYISTTLSVMVDESCVVSVGNIVEICFERLNNKCTFLRVRLDRAISDTKGRVDTVLVKMPLSKAGFLSFASKLKVLQNSDCKTVRYTGDDIVKKLGKMAGKQPARVLDIPCQHYLRGNCSAGIFCAYKHQNYSIANLLHKECYHCKTTTSGTVDAFDGLFYCFSCWEQNDKTSKFRQ